MFELPKDGIVPIRIETEASKYLVQVSTTHLVPLQKVRNFNTSKAPLRKRVVKKTTKTLPPITHTTNHPHPSSLCRSLFQPASSATLLAVLMAVQLLPVAADPYPSQTPQIPTTPPTKASSFASQSLKQNQTLNYTVNRSSSISHQSNMHVI